MTREEAIKQIREDICCEKPIQHHCRDGCMHGKEQCAYSLAIEALGNDTNVGSKWIPIGQYPSEPSLLCFEDGSMVVGYYNYDDDGWVVCTSDIFETDLIEDDIESAIVAWQPLPEPYKGE